MTGGGSVCLPNATLLWGVELKPCRSEGLALRAVERSSDCVHGAARAPVARRNRINQTILKSGGTGTKRLVANLVHVAKRCSADALPSKLCSKIDKQLDVRKILAPGEIQGGKRTCSAHEANALPGTASSLDCVSPTIVDCLCGSGMISCLVGSAAERRRRLGALMPAAADAGAVTATLDVGGDALT